MDTTTTKTVKLEQLEYFKIILVENFIHCFVISVCNYKY